MRAMALWLLLPILAVGGCSREPAPQRPDPMSGEDVTRIVEDAIVRTMGDPDQTGLQRRIALQETRYAQSDWQVRTMHSVFRSWMDYEKLHPRRWYHWFDIGELGGGLNQTREVDILSLRISARAAIEQACSSSFSIASEQTVYLDDRFGDAQIGGVYAIIDQDVTRCMGNRRDLIKSLKATAAPGP